MKVKITQVTTNTFNVELVGIMSGRIACLRNALTKYAEESQGAAEIKQALEESMKNNDQLNNLAGG